MVARGIGDVSNGTKIRKFKCVTGPVSRCRGAEGTAWWLAARQFPSCAAAWMSRKIAVLDQYLREQQNTQYGNCMLAKKPAHQTQSGECRRAH